MTRLERLGIDYFYYEGSKGTFSCDGKMLVYSREVKGVQEKLTGYKPSAFDAVERVIESKEGNETGLVKVPELGTGLKALRVRKGEEVPLLDINEKSALIISYSYYGGNVFEVLMTAEAEVVKTYGIVEALLDAKRAKSFPPKDSLIGVGKDYVTYVSVYKRNEYKVILMGLDRDKKRSTIVKQERGEL
jgi:hypothetical protein